MHFKLQNNKWCIILTLSKVAKCKCGQNILKFAVIFIALCAIKVEEVCGETQKREPKEKAHHKLEKLKVDRHSNTEVSNI